MEGMGSAYLREIHHTSYLGPSPPTHFSHHPPRFRWHKLVWCLVSRLCRGTARGGQDSRFGLRKIPRLELVAAHMGANLVSNVEKASITVIWSKTHCWSDSTAALHWINGSGDYRQFVSNRVAKIRGHDRVQWHYVPTKENPADIGSRGGSTVNDKLWTNSPEWLSLCKATVGVANAFASNHTKTNSPETCPPLVRKAPLPWKSLASILQDDWQPHSLIQRTRERFPGRESCTKRSTVMLPRRWRWTPGSNASHDAKH